MPPIPLLFLGDSPDSHTGLGRIMHDLCWLFSSIPDFRVGCLGRAGFGRAKYPWTQYQFSAAEQWGEGRLVEAWEDLSRGQEGIIFTVWDASRLLWFAHPVGMPESVKALLGSPRIKKWAYCMVDSAGVNPFRLPLEQQTVLEAFDRVLIASKWGHALAKESLPSHNDLDWLPHPINRKTFYPRDRSAIRSAWGLRGDTKIVGCCMTNQARKHWPTVMEAIAMMPDTVLWVHTDLEMDVWNLPALALEYGIQDRIIMECQQMADSELALRYSTCDATVLISGGEGFGYPVAESLSCGVPVVSGSYGAQAELCHEHMLVPPEHFRIETNHNVRRAGYSAAQVADRLEHAIKAKREGDVDFTALVEHLDFKHLGILWKKWARKGVAQ